MKKKSGLKWLKNSWISIPNTTTNNTASKTGILSQKLSYIISLLENTTYGLSALKNAITSSSSVGNTSIKGISVYYGMPYNDSSKKYRCDQNDLYPIAKFIAPVPGVYRVTINAQTLNYHRTLLKLGKNSMHIQRRDGSFGSPNYTMILNNYMDPYTKYNSCQVGYSRLISNNNYCGQNVTPYISVEEIKDIWSNDDTYISGYTIIDQYPYYSSNKIFMTRFYCEAGEPVVLALSPLDNYNVNNYQSLTLRSVKVEY